MSIQSLPIHRGWFIFPQGRAIARPPFNQLNGYFGKDGQSPIPTEIMFHSILRPNEPKTNPKNRPNPMLENLSKNHSLNHQIFL